MAREIVRVGLDAQGKVVEKAEDAVMVIESVWDENSRLLRETLYYRAEGNRCYQSLPNISVSKV
jgi:hypothetical protein